MKKGNEMKEMEMDNPKEKEGRSDIAYCKPTGDGLVKEGRLCTDDGAVNLERATTAENGHIGKLARSEETGQGVINRRGADILNRVKITVSVLSAG